MRLDSRSGGVSWPWAIWRRFRRDMRDLAVRHARERAALTAWRIEVLHALAERGDL